MKDKFTTSLSGKILHGYMAVILLSAITFLACIVVQNQSLLISFILTIACLSVAISSITVYQLNRHVILPIREIDVAMRKASKGETVEQLSFTTEGEIGRIRQSISLLVEGQRTKSQFAAEIGKGNYEQEFKPLSEQDTIGAALLEMRNNLRKSAEEEKRRNWSTTGLAQIGEILRQAHTSRQQLYDQILTFLVKYMNANQGGLFHLQDEATHVQLELVACYAYNRKKYQQKQITAGEGLVGQAFLEKDTIVLTDIPEDYLNITSGLGHANPRCLLIVPLKNNDQVHGIIEMASFHVFEKHQIEFVEKIAESIASTIANVKTNEVTRKLLDETQVQTEQMRAQEEEMRQNMEELMATQENQLRLQEELKANEEIMKASMFELQDSKLQLEKKEAELIQANEKSQTRANKFREKLEIMDGEMENKTSQINMLKKTNEELLEKLSKYENQQTIN
jgi:putative methionine-R-sulfoxide reductase with GAF domain